MSRSASKRARRVRGESAGVSVHREEFVANYRDDPLPTPEDFGKYGEVLADAPERILRMAENHSKAAIEIGHTGQRHLFVATILGIVPIGLVMLALAAAAIVAIILEQTTAGIWLGVADLAILVLASIPRILNVFRKPEPRR